MSPEVIKKFLEVKVPVYLVPDAKKGIKKDCPLELRAKEYKRKALTILMLRDAELGISDEDIIAKYLNKEI
jgi:hypothetical protein